MTGRPEIIPLELGTFRFPEPELAHRQGVVMGYAVRHRGGIFLFDTGLGFGNAGARRALSPGRQARSRDALAEVGVDLRGRRPPSRTATCMPITPARTRRSRTCRSTSRPTEWEIAHTTDHTILEWIDFAGRTLRPARPATTNRSTASADRDHARPYARPPVAGRRHGPRVRSSSPARPSTRSRSGWASPTPLEGRSSAPDRDAYDRSIERLHAPRAGARPLRPRPAVLESGLGLTSGSRIRGILPEPC